MAEYAASPGRLRSLTTLPGCPWLSRSSLAFLAVIVLLLLSTPFVKLNIEPSVPYGFYRLRTLPPTLTYGMLVLMPAPLSVAPWHSGWTFLKPIAGLPGDQVCVLSTGLWINGEPYGFVYTRANGMDLPRLRGCWAVPEGHVFLATKTVATLDSRYFNSVPVAHVSALATPLWTWR